MDLGQYNKKIFFLSKDPSRRPAYMLGMDWTVCASSVGTMVKAGASSK